MTSTNDFSNKDLETNLDLFSAWVEAQMAYRGQPGLSVGLIYDQELIWSRGFGYANVEQKSPAASDTLYRIASITKLFTSTAIMQLRDEGLLQLDDPVEKHLPWFSIQNPHEDTPPITIRHLLIHAAGLPREAAFPYWSTNNFPAISALQEALPSQTLAIPTASDWKYSNLGLTLAGEIVAAISQTPYARYIEENILRPLGMDNTYVETVPADHELLATGYGRRLPDGSRALSPHIDCGAITPAANMASNIEDLAKFAMLQFRGGARDDAQILRGSSLREMHRVQWLNDDWSAGRGIGYFVWRVDNRTWVGHGGALQGYRTELQVAPADKVGVIVLTNADDGQPLFYMQKAFEWVVPALIKAKASTAPTSQASPEWARYTGRYRSAWGDSQVLVYKDELVIITPSAPDPLAAMTKLVPVAEHTFRMETKERFGANGELAIFELDETGKVVRLHTGNSYTTPIDDW